MSIEAIQKVSEEIGGSSIDRPRLTLLSAELSARPPHSYEGAGQTDQPSGVKSVASHDQAETMARRWARPCAPWQGKPRMRLSAAEKKAAALPAN
jgi:hypothetical protein